MIGSRRPHPSRPRRTDERSGHGGLRRIVQLARRGFDTLVPAACVSCGRGVSADAVPFCGLCRVRAPALPSPRCPRCAEPVGALPRGAPFSRCGVCEDWPESIAAADAVFAFEGTAARAIKALKYDGWRILAPWMAGRMLTPARAVLRRLGGSVEPPLVIPVPLAPARARERGFNQARDLAERLAEELGGDLEEALRREPGGGRQAQAGGASRRRNVQGRFAARRGPSDPLRPVLLVDDVLTTGSTIFACGHALCEAGFRPIAVVTFARTLRPLDAPDQGRVRG